MSSYRTTNYFLKEFSLLEKNNVLLMKIKSRKPKTKGLELQYDCYYFWDYNQSNAPLQTKHESAMRLIDNIIFSYEVQSILIGQSTFELMKLNKTFAASSLQIRSEGSLEYYCGYLRLSGTKPSVTIKKTSLLPEGEIVFVFYVEVKGVPQERYGRLELRNYPS